MPETHTKLPDWLVPGTALAVFLVGCCILPGYLLTRPTRCGNRTLKCAMQLRSISQAISLYAELNHGELPPPGDGWAELLIYQGYVPAEMFLSPSAWEEYDRSSYAYVPAARLETDGDRVLLYEVPGLHAESGVHIAFHDGHMALLPVAEAERLIAECNAADPLPTRPAIDPDAGP